MTILLFLVILVALIVVHEFGHFVLAKLFKMRVEEFGIGYPPRALTYARKDGTDYTLNWLPFGGFVKIYGEDDSATGSPASDSFASKPRIQQALVLLAGIGMNIFFAWILFALAVGIGMPRALTHEEALSIPDAHLVVSRVVAGSPAEKAGLIVGDTISTVSAGEKEVADHSAESFTGFISTLPSEIPVRITVLRDGETKEIEALPAKNVVPNDPERIALGVGVASVGTVSAVWWQAPLEGLRITWNATEQIAVGLVHFFGSLATFTADLSQVAGPVGIAGAVGDASASGLASLLTLTAVISINLALVNLIPVPALDGGRLLFVIIEAITRKPIPQGVAGAANTIGFGLLILLMLVITASDIFKLIG